MADSLKDYVRAAKIRLNSKRAKRGLPPVIASFTSYPARLWAAAIAVKNLFSQTVRPDEILLWLDEDEFHAAGITKQSVEEEFSYLPVKICWAPTGYNLRSFNKYFWILQERPDVLLITFDDDLRYRPTLIEELLEAHRRFPTAFISARSHLPILSEDERIAPYRTWIFEQQEILLEPSYRAFANDGCGSLWPPKTFSKDFFDIEMIRKICEFNDDIWVNLYLWRNDIPKVIVPDATLLYIEGTQGSGLCRENLDKNRNDVYFRNAFDEFSGLEEKLIEQVKKSEKKSVK